MKYHYTVITVFSLENLEKLLNTIESQATNNYDIMSIFSRKETICVIIRFHIQDDDVIFDEEEIKRKLGF